MNNLQFLIGRKPKFYDVSDMIVKAVSSGARGNEYSGAAEPPFRWRVSQGSGRN